MNFLSFLAPHAHWFLRLSLAATFIFHGWLKFPVSAGAQMMGMPEPMVLAVALAEIVGGAALVVGAFSRAWLTRLGGLIVIVIMLGAIVLVHGKNGWNVMSGGMEFQALMLAAGVYFAARGNDV